MRHPFVALAICLLARAAAAQSDAGVQVTPVTGGGELIKASTLAPRSAAAAATAVPAARVVALGADPLEARPTAPDDGPVSAGGLELALAALALMSGIALRRYMTGSR